MPSSRRRQALSILDAGSTTPREAAVEAPVERLLALSCDWTWTLDAALCLRRLGGRAIDAGPHPFLARLGEPPGRWIGVERDDDGWARLCAALDARTPFHDNEHVERDGLGLPRYVSMSGEPIVDANGRFAGFRGVARDVTSRKRAEALSAMEHAVTRGLAAAETSRKVLQAVMRVVCEAERWETGGYFRVEPDGTAHLEAGWMGPGMTPAAVEYYKRTSARVVPAGGMLSRVVETGEPLWLSALAESQTTWAQRVRATGERATFFCPVRVESQVIGVFAFASRQIREPDPPLLQTMRVIGEQVGQFIQRREAARILRESEARFRALTSLSSDWYWEIDADARFTRLEGRQVECTEGSAIGRTRWELGLAIDSPGGWAAHREWLAARVAFRDVGLTRPGDAGATRHISISGEPMFARDGGYLGYRGVGRDVTVQRLAEKKIEHLATHDALTGLPNRLLFDEQLGLATRLAARRGRRVAVLFIDLDCFKLVNDEHGHDAGDTVLRVMAGRFRDCLRESDVVARLGGDEFVVLLQDLELDSDVGALAGKLLVAAAQPIATRAGDVRVTASIGVSLCPTDAEDKAALLKHADLAMYRAKASGRNGVGWFAAGRR